MESGIKILFLPLLITTFVNGFSYQRVSLQSEICGFYNGHRKYLELGDSGQLSATNITVPSYIQEVTKKFNQSLTMQCTLELVTCPSCIIKVTFNHINFPSNCEYAKNGAGVCRCDYIVLSEPPYDSQKDLVYNCGNMLTYQSQTRSLQIKFVYWNNYSDAFQLEYISERNREVVTLNGDAVEKDEKAPPERKTKMENDGFKVVPTSRLAVLPPAFTKDSAYATEYVLAWAVLPIDEEDKVEAFDQDVLNKTLQLNVEFITLGSCLLLSAWKMVL